MPLSRLTDRPRRATGGRRLLFLFFLCWPVVLVSSGGSSMSDSVLLTAIRLVDHHTWTLSDRSDPKTVFLTEAHDISVHDGRIYSGVGPGASVVAAPFYAMFKPVFSRFDERIIANRRFLNYYMRNGRALGEVDDGRFRDLYLLQIVLVWFLIAPLFAAFLCRLHDLLSAGGCDRTHAAFITVAAGLGTMALYYSCMYSRQSLAYLLVWHAILSLAGKPAPGRRSCLIAGSLCGAAIPIDYPSAILVGLTLLFLLPRMDMSRRLLVVTPVLAALGLTALYQLAIFGSPFATPYHSRFWFTYELLADKGLDLAAFQQGPSLGMNPPDLGVMWRLCFGPFKGLFVYSPVLLAGLIGHLLGLRNRIGRGFHVFSLLVFLIYLVFNSTLGTHVPGYGQHFWGGLSVLWGPRYLFAVLPFLACGLAQLDWRRAPVRWICFGLLVVSCAFNLLGAMFNQVIMSTYAFGPELRFPLAYVLELVLRRGPRVPLLDAYGVHPAAQAAVLLALALLAIFLLRQVLRPSPSGDGARDGSTS